MGRYTGWDAKAAAKIAEKTFLPKVNKYNAKKVVIDGIMFDSKKEAARYNELKLMQKAKVIHRLEVHPKYPIKINDTKVCDVELDFSYQCYAEDRIIEHHEDVKGKDNPMSQLKRKMVEAYYGINVEIL